MKIREVSCLRFNLFFSTAAQNGLGCERRSGVMSGTVLALRPKDRVRQDSEPIAQIYRTMGTHAAEQVVTRALAELGLTVAGLAQLMAEQDLDDLPRRLRRLQRISEQLGVTSLATVAADARLCLEQGEAVAFSAVWARLLRVAELSLSGDLGLHDKTP
jgi:hypothetical protein